MKLLRLLPLLLLPLTAGCSDLFGPDVDGRLKGLDGQIRFLVREIHGFEFDEVGDPQIALYMVTERTYGCRGHVIEGTVDVEGSLVVVDIAGIREPTVCFQTTEPAEVRGFLGIDAGTWTFRFVHGDRVSEYTVVIGEDAIDITGEDDDVAIPDYARFWRYPVNSFALGCDRAGGFPEICAELGDSILATPGVAAYAFGEGGIPYPVSYTDVQFSWLVTYFTYVDRDAWIDARGRAADFYGRFPGLRYYVLDWRNEQGGSWP